MPAINRACSNTFTYFNATLLTPVFQVCDPGIPHPCFLLKIINTSNVNVIISYDGVYAHDVILEYSVFNKGDNELILPFQECKRTKSHINLLARGTPIYVAAETDAGKTGNIYVISYYQPVIG